MEINKLSNEELLELYNVITEVIGNLNAMKEEK